jgi:transposase-like protein
VATERTYRKFAAQRKLEIVLAGLRSDRSVRDVCREAEISENLYYAWRDKLLQGAAKSWPARMSARAKRSFASASASSSGPWVARPTSSRSRGKHCARRPRALCAGPQAERRLAAPAIVRLRADRHRVAWDCRRRFGARSGALGAASRPRAGGLRRFSAGRTGGLRAALWRALGGGIPGTPGRAVT